MTQLQRKTALSSFDLAILIQQLNLEISSSKINIVNSSKDAIVLKLHSPTNQSKPKLVITSAAIYTTNYEVSSASAPSAFVVALRKEISGYYVNSIVQVNFDRVVIISLRKGFSVAKLLVIELFGKGNIYLTDTDYRILQSQNVNKQAVYTIQKGISLQQIKDSLTEKQFYSILEEAKSAKGQKNQLRYVLANRYYIGGALASIILRRAGLSASTKCANPKINKEQVYDLLSRLMVALFESLSVKKAYLYFYEDKDLVFEDENLEDEVRRSLKVQELYSVDLNAVFPGLYQPQCVTAVDSFIAGVDQYFTMLQTALAYQSRIVLIAAQSQKHEKLQDENQARMAALLARAQYYRFLGAIATYQQPLIDAVLAQLVKMFSCGALSWGTIQRDLEQSCFKIFNFVDSVEVVQRVFTLRVLVQSAQLHDLGFQGFSQVARLCDEGCDGRQREDCAASDSEASTISEAPERQEQIFLLKAKLDQSALRVAEGYFQQAKQLELKAGKTQAQADAAFSKVKSQADAKIDQILKQTDDELLIFKQQKSQLWFEKFNWFVSSQGFLVVSGRDAQQNELLIKKFMAPGDAFVHADVHGAACTVVKARTPTRQQFPDQTMQEAACHTVTHSRLWDTKVSAQSYWVYGDQVSKTAPSGQFIGTGSFVIRGKRNFLDVQEMKLGAFLLFRYEERQPYYPELYSEEQSSAPCTETREDEKYTIISTKKQKVVQKTQQDLIKSSNKVKQKEARKIRQQKIAEMKFQAKIKRLNAEGREEEALECVRQKQTQKQEIEVEEQNFCFLCAGAHKWTECQKYSERSSEGEEENEEEEERSILSENDEENVAQNKENNNYALLESAYLLSPLYEKEKNPSICVSIAPLAAIPSESKRLEIQPGNTQKGQAANIIRSFFQSVFSDEKGLVQMIKNIQDCNIMFAIPGSCQFQGYGVNKIVQGLERHKK